MNRAMPLLAALIFSLPAIGYGQKHFLDAVAIHPYAYFDDYEMFKEG